MLAQNFKSAADLGITEPQLSALQKTLVLLETGKLVFSTPGYDKEFEPQFSGQFNMCSWADKNECGTVACIGGTAELLAGEEVFGGCGGNFPPRLYDLFFPDYIWWSKISTDQAATALRSYLTTGDARWDLAVA